MSTVSDKVLKNRNYEIAIDTKNMMGIKENWQICWIRKQDQERR